MSVTEKVLPHSIEAERCVIGSLLLDDSSFDKVVELLEPDDFFSKENRIVFDSLCKINEDDQPIDPVIVIAFIEKHKLMLGDFHPYIYEMANEVPTPRNVIAYSSIVRERSILRQLIGAYHEIYDMCVSNNDYLDVKDLLHMAEAKVRLIKERMHRCDKTSKF